MKAQNASLHARVDASTDEDFSHKRGFDSGAWGQYWQMFQKCERQRRAILDIQASPRGLKHWVPEYLIDEQPELQEILDDCA